MKLFCLNPLYVIALLHLSLIEQRRKRRKEFTVKNDDFGDRMKMFEGRESQRRLMPLLPVMVRIDGKCFSKFTKGLKRPYDERMSQLMVETTKALVEETNALIGYTQSDEISLVLYSGSMQSQVYYDGRVQKMVGDLAAFASGVFNYLLPKYLPEKVPTNFKKFPRFDCRVWDVPNKIEAANTILWREQDSSKNSLSSAAHTYFSHSSLQSKNGSEMQEMLFSKGINWNDYPSFFKRGTFVRRRIMSTKYTAEDLAFLPSKHEARKNPDLLVERSVIEVMDMPPFSRVINRVGVIFDGENPLIDGRE